MQENRNKGHQFMSSVKVGPKGQIVIPKEAREMFDIKPGDTLLLLADKSKGIAIQRLDYFNAIADAIFSGQGKSLYPEESEENLKIFAQEVSKVTKSEEKSNV